MKMNKKKVFALALAVCLIATLSMGSLAWFTDEDSVMNSFMIATSEEDTADEIFSVDVWEYTPDDADGDGEPDKIKDQNGYKYEDILPGDALLKDVHVENTGYYDQFVRVTVWVSDSDIWQEALGLGADEVPELGEIVSNINKVELYGVSATELNGKFVYVLYYKNILAPGETFNVFQQVDIPEELTREQAAKFNENGESFTIEVKAEAVQTKNVGDNVFDAFETVGKTPSVTTVYVTEWAELAAAAAKHDNVTIELVNDITADGTITIG